MKTPQIRGLKGGLQKEMGKVSKIAKKRTKALPVLASTVAIYEAGLETGIPCIDKCFRKVRWVVNKVRMRLMRRRASFRLFMYFMIQGVTCLLVFIGALIVYITIWNGFNTVNQDCITDVTFNLDIDLYNFTRDNLHSPVCKDLAGSAEDVGAACDLTDLNAILDAALASGIVLAAQAAVCLVVGMSFRMFTNLPVELLQHGKTTFCSKFLGGVCKMFPWLNRLCHFTQGSILLVFWCLLFNNYCQGPLEFSAHCKNYRADCGYNKLKNCRYYYAHCAPDTAAFKNCWTALERTPFSGRVDIRILTTDSCAICQMLENDVLLADNVDEYYLLDEADRAGANWMCDAAAASCYHSEVWSSIACNCPATASTLDSTKLATLTSACPAPAAARRMEDDEGQQQQPPQRHDDDELEQWLAPQHWRSSQRSLEDWRSQELEDEDAGATEWAPWALPSQDGEVGNLTVRWLEPRRLQADNSTVVWPTEALTAQQCANFPSVPEAYWFEGTDCSLQDSGVYFACIIYCYLGITFWGCSTCLGQLVRVTSKPEPWFIQPPEPNESIIWRLFRYVGP